MNSHNISATSSVSNRSAAFSDTEILYLSPGRDEVVQAHHLSKPFTLAIGIALLVIIVVAVIGNVLLVSLIATIKKMHSVLHVFIVNLAISDLVTAAGSIPFDAEYMLRGCFVHGKVACGIMNIVFLISLPSSVFSLTLLTAERLIVILYPYKAKNILRKSYVTFTLISVWIYVFFIGLFPIMYNENAVLVAQGNCHMSFPQQFTLFLVILNFLLPILFICVANVIMFVIAQKCYKDQVSITLSLVKQNTAVSRSTSADKLKPLVHERLSRITGNLKAAKRIGLLVGIFLLCWLSYIIIVTSNSICKCHPQEVIWIANVVNYSAAAINPVLYGLLNKNIRKEVVRKARRYQYFVQFFQKD